MSHEVYRSRLKLDYHAEKLQKNPRAKSVTVLASVNMLNVKAHDSTIRKSLTGLGHLAGRARLCIPEY